MLLLSSWASANDIYAGGSMLTHTSADKSKIVQDVVSRYLAR